MRFGWAVPHLDTYSLKEWENILGAIASAGFHGIEPLIAHPAQIPTRDFLDLLAENELEIFAFRTGAIAKEHNVTFNAPTQAERDEAVRRFIAVIRFAAGYGKPHLIVGWIQGWKREQQSYAEVEENLAFCLRKCAVEAEKDGITILLEPLNTLELNYHNRVGEVVAYLDRVQIPGIGIVLDTYHMKLEGEDFREAIRSARSYLEHFHLADEKRCTPRWSEFEYPMLQNVLEQIGYQGGMTLETNEPSSKLVMLHAQDFLSAFQKN